MKSLKGYLLIIGAAGLWGISATVAKFLFTNSIDALTLTQTRVTIAFLLFAVSFAIFRRKYFSVRARDIPRFVLLGLVSGVGSTYAYYATIERTNVATAIILQYLAPLFVIVYAAVTKEERLTPVKIAAGALSLTGCFFAVGGGDLTILRINGIGLATGVTAALCWGATNILLRRVLRFYSIWTSLLYSFFFASLFWLVVHPPWAVAGAGYSASDWGIFTLFAVLSILIPHSLYFAGIRHLTASSAIITASIEPVIAIVSAFIVLHETLTPVQCVGAALVISTIVLLQSRRDPVEELQP